MIAKYSIMLLVLTTLACSSGFSQRKSVRNPRQESVEEVIKRLERERFNAYLKLDASALERIMSNGYTSVYADGQIVTKAEELAAMKSAPTGILLSISASIDQDSVNHVGPSAVLVGRLTLKGNVEWLQKPIVINAAFRYTAVYVKNQGRWQIVASQFTRIDESLEK